MTRLLTIVLTLLIGIALPAKPQDCCDPVPAGHCNHPQAPLHNSPCEPTFSSCPAVACLTEQNPVVSPSANLQRVLRDASLVAQPLNCLTPRTSLERVSIGQGTSDRIKPARLFLLNRALVI
jgi:hypothetical protein